MVWLYYNVSARTFFAQCFVFVPRQVSAPYIGRGGSRMPDGSCRCHWPPRQREQPGQGHPRCKDRLLQGLFCVISTEGIVHLGLTLLLGSPRAFSQDDRRTWASPSWAVVAWAALAGHVRAHDAWEWATLLACGPRGGFGFPFFQ